MIFKLHREGIRIVLISTILFLGILYMSKMYFPVAFWPLVIVLGGVWIWVLSFFRDPTREIVRKDDTIVYAPADGKVVVIEKTKVDEHLQGEFVQISIFMSPMNVHVNRVPISGKVSYVKYHPGKYLVAWHPKSSTENERHTTVIENDHGVVLLRQIAGAMARRIINYMNPGQEVVQGQELGFIRFGSRVDVFLPLDADVQVKMDQIVKGNQTVIAHLAQS